ncbi:hypothetical protein ABJB24_10045, partial [Bifidobacterium breve]|nr:hypothetical protein [Bifidobacterium breve]
NWTKTYRFFGRKTHATLAYNNLTKHKKRPGRQPMAPVGQGEDASGRPSEPDVFARLDDMLARIAPSSHLLPPRQARY